MLISTGMATFEEIGEALETAKTGGCNDYSYLPLCKQLSNPDIGSKLVKINLLKKEFSVHVGLSDHTKGTTQE